MRVADAALAGTSTASQEAVNNSLKHGRHPEARIGLERRDGALVLADTTARASTCAPPAAGIGFRVMRYRAQLIGGVLEFGSAPAGGARISCRVKWLA